MRAAFLGLAFVLGLMACSSAGGAGDDEPGTGTPGAGGSGSSAGGEGGASGEGSEGGSAGTGINIGGSQGSGGQKECQSKETPGKRIPASILIVLDRSGSMNDNGKWSAATGAINQMLKSADQELAMGLLRFPEGTPDNCPPFNPFDFQQTCDNLVCTSEHDCVDIKVEPNVPVAALKTSGAQIQNLIATTKPNGGTPTLGALNSAYAYMQKLQTDSERFVLLVTDGVPTFATGAAPGSCLPPNVACGTKAQLGQSATDARKGSPPVRTFVIGAPGSEDGLEILSGLALNGGTCKPGGSHASYTCHYQIGAANFEQELAATLTQIAGSVSNCTYAVPAPDGQEVDPELVNVVVTTSEGEKTIFKDESQADGWNYTDDSKTKVQIFGPQCEAINKGTEATVKIALGCKTQVK